MNKALSNQALTQTVCIQGGIVIDPGHVNGRADVLIQNGKIVEVGYPLKQSIIQDATTTILDASGWVVAPGLVDLHLSLIHI